MAGPGMRGAKPSDPHFTPRTLFAFLKRRLSQRGRARLDEGPGDRFAQRRIALAEQLAGVGSWSLDVATGEVAWSEQLYRICGLDRADFQPRLQDTLALHADGEGGTAADRLARAIDTGEGFACKARLRRVCDGAERVVTSRAERVRDEDTGVQTVFGVIQDVTDEDAVLEQVSADRERYRLLAENATDMICKYGVDGTISFVSPACEKIMGFMPEEMIGRKTIEFIHPDDLDAVRKQFYDYVTKGSAGRPMSTRHRIIHRNGEVLWLEGRPLLIRSAPSEPSEYYDVMRDVTERVRLEEELSAARIAAEAAALAKTEFLANMSHELRTPLTAVIGFANLATEQPELSSKSRLYVQRIQTAGRALLSTVNDVLDFSKLEAGQVTLCPWPTSPLQLAQEVLDLVSAQAATKNLALTLEAAADLPTLCELDADKVRQVLTNLIGNAVKFTEAGGVAVRLSYSDPRLGFEIRDTGAGIPPDRLNLLFQRFSQVDGSNTRRHGGTGLGLAICKGLADAMGGSVEVESTVGSGSTFRFDVPAPVTQALAPDGGQAPSNPPQEGRRLLLAENNDVNRDLIKALLEPQGLDVTAVASGEEAIIAASGTSFDLILMGLDMPGVGGCEAARRIRAASFGPTPILAFSNDALQPEMDMFDGLVVKTVSSPDLMRAIERHLKLHQTAPRPPPEVCLSLQ